MKGIRPIYFHTPLACVIAFIFSSAIYALGVDAGVKGMKDIDLCSKGSLTARVAYSFSHIKAGQISSFPIYKQGIARGIRKEATSCQDK